MEKFAATKIIVDLYEMRVSTFNKYSEKSELVLDNFKYHFFSSAIAQICDKYKVTEQDIREELNSRKVKDFLTTNTQ